MIAREKRLISSVIDKLDLDLQGFNVLTEVGSRNFVYTPIIALAAGAENVFAWTRDSKFGNGSDIIQRCQRICREFGLPGSRIMYAENNRPVEHIQEADIITNLGFVRPLNRAFLSNVEKKVVIPYMCDAWEFREGDVDIDYCREKGIKVAGTWENHPSLQIFDGCAHLIAKLCFESSFEIYQNKILVISRDKFGEVACSVFKTLRCDQVDIVSPFEFDGSGLAQYDFVLLADYSTNCEVFSSSFFEANPVSDIAVVHLCGNLDLDIVARHGFTVYPEENGQAKRMSRTLDYLGAKPLIDLHAAGLKVAENLYHGNEHDLVQVIV